VVEQPAFIRRTFFDKLLQEARPFFKNIFEENHLENLIKKLKTENERYLKN
jgi:hypothetical protein